MTREEANLKEKEYISWFGRRDLGTGQLVNMKDGGDSGKASPETRKRISESARRRFQDPAERERMRIIAINRPPVSTATREKISKRMKGTSLELTAESREKIRLKLTGRKWGPRSEKWKQSMRDAWALRRNKTLIP